MRSILLAACAVAGFSGLTAPAWAQAPVAVVEEVKGKPAGIEFMDYVAPGKVIKLGPKDTIVLGYMKSCWRETITGGTVVVGAEQSLVHLGEVERVKVDCGGAKRLTSQETHESAAAVFRNMTPAQQANTPPRLTIYGLSPIVEVEGGGKLVIERLDKQGERHDVTVHSESLLHGRFYDFAKAKKALTAGGTYAASHGGHEIVFKVDPAAKPGATPVVGRLLRFE